MGVSSSKTEEDKALQLCRERRKFVRQSLDGRCSLAAAHVMYIQSLKNTGSAIWKFVEPEAPIESSLYTSTSATPEPLALTEKSVSQFSFSSPALSHPVEATENLSPLSSPFSSSQFQVNHMKFRGFSSKRVEEKPPVVTGTVMSSSTPQNTTPQFFEKTEASPFEPSLVPPVSPLWDYFEPYHPIDHQFSSQEQKEMNQGLENVDDVRRLREEERVPELEEEDEEEKDSYKESEDSADSEDEFDDPPADTLVRSFENLNRVHDQVVQSSSPTMPSAASETELLNREVSNSLDVSPLRTPSSAVATSNSTKKTPVKEGQPEKKVAPKDFFSSIKDIEYLFIRASDSGREVPRMLEANKLHFRPIVPSKENQSVVFIFLRACFSCGEDPSQVPEEPAQTAVRYLTWHRTTSSRSSSSRNLPGLNAKDDTEDLTGNVFENVCMISGSHASTLDRLFAWEKKLYDEVKASAMVRRDYDAKCRYLRELESNGESSQKIDKTRAIVKDLHSRIRVAIQRIDSLSKRIEELRDKELQPQLEELIEGLSRMWEVMFECHRLQFNIISIAYNNENAKISVQAEAHRHITIHFGSELATLSSSFTKWIGAQKSYLQAINNWLHKCVFIPQKPSKRKRRQAPLSLRSKGPPIYATCGAWLEKLEALPAREVAESIKNLAAETTHFLPRQEKNQGKATDQTSRNADNGSDSAVNMLKDEASEDMVSGIERFRSSLEGFLGRLNQFAESSVKMYAELQKEIQEAKSKYEQIKSQSQSI
uniref:Uncharacterized protein MANES_04G052500 n=1 Tax=Rhizophora mucronata TaxID=61149 RepID=A0A2P2JPW1_RHIMU